LRIENQTLGRDRKSIDRNGGAAKEASVEYAV
jgi:hypothetical protein